MVEFNGEQVYALLEQRGAAGLALEVLGTSSTLRTKENYEKVKKTLETSQKFPTAQSLIDWLETMLEYEEVMFVTFRKTKCNGKTGHKRMYSQGLFYYVGRDPDHLSKVYVHFATQKAFLLDSIQRLKISELSIKHAAVNCLPNISIYSFDLFEGSKHCAEIALYIGYSLN